jgi:nitroimidazol reductase NimA-like FMN-containing flavoprotein (pyridoxamine 5'-phosphate oxidase superfamily)
VTTTDDDRTRQLDAQTCRQLLGTVRVGRVALPDEPSPTVLPVDFVTHGDRVLFRTVEGAKLETARAHGPASFQADGYDPSHDTGWSVLVRGHLEEVDGQDPDVEAAVGRLHPLAGGARPHVVALTIESATGRRIPQDPAWVRAHRETNTWIDRDASDLLG